MQLRNPIKVWQFVCLFIIYRHTQQFVSYMMTVSFIGGRENPDTLFIVFCIIRPQRRSPYFIFKQILHFEGP
jgi:hypothetical protein